MQNSEKLKKLGYLNEKGEFGPDIWLYYKKFGLNERGVATMGTASICVMRLDAEHQRLAWELAGIYNRYVARTYPLYIRGISLCSPLDQFVKSLGRAVAIGRALGALEKTSSEKVPKLLLNYGFNYLSEWDVKLTEEESRLFKIKPTSDSPASALDDLLKEAMNISALCLEKMQKHWEENKLPDGTSE